jgi:hypothetical protein
MRIRWVAPPSRSASRLSIGRSPLTVGSGDVAASVTAARNGDAGRPVRRSHPLGTAQARGLTVLKKLRITDVVVSGCWDCG